MFIPANFAIGALVGAAASYVYKDDSAREVVSGLGSKVKQGFDALMKKTEEATDKVSDLATGGDKDTAEAVVEEAEVVAEDKSDKAK